jgi:hypothetical protein
MTEEPQSTDPLIAALLREREALIQSGLHDRVAEVDEQLRQHGHHMPVDRAAKAPASRSTQPKGRRARGSETT